MAKQILNTEQFATAAYSALFLIQSMDTTSPAVAKAIEDILLVAPPLVVLRGVKATLDSVDNARQAGF